jgi:hypothetical protein
MTTKFGQNHKGNHLNFHDGEEKSHLVTDRLDATEIATVIAADCDDEYDLITDEWCDRFSWMEPDAFDLLLDNIQDYTCHTRPTVVSIHRKVVVAFEERNVERLAGDWDALPVPSYHFVRRAILSMDAFAVHVARHGEASALRRFGSDSVEVVTSSPGNRIEVDEWNVDLTALVDPLLEGLFSKPNSWTMHGLTQHVQTDNGTAFKSTMSINSGEAK